MSCAMFRNWPDVKSSEPHTSHLLAQLVAQLANYWHVIHVLDSTGHVATFDSLWHLLTHVDTHIESTCCCRRSCVYSFTTLSQSQGAFQIEAVVAFLRQSLVVSCHSALASVHSLKTTSCYLNVSLRILCTLHLYLTVSYFQGQFLPSFILIPVVENYFMYGRWSSLLNILASFCLADRFFFLDFIFCLMSLLKVTSSTWILPGWCILGRKRPVVGIG